MSVSSLGLPDAGKLELRLETLEPRILLSVPAGVESLVGAEWSFGTRSAPSVPFTDNFNDNSQGALWGLLEDAPTEVWLDERQGRLELRSDGSSSEMQNSFYVGNAWALDTWNDFAFKADWHFTAGGGGAGALDLTIVAAPPEGFCSLGILAGTDGSVDFAMASGETFGQEDIEDAVERDLDSGTVYVSYDASADRLSLSGNGYWRTQHNPTNGDWVYQGKVWGEWGAETVGVALGGIASGMTLGAGDAYLDDLTVDQGTVVAPAPQSLPYTEDFSSGRPGMAQGWDFLECEGGRVQVTSGRLRMDDVMGDDVYSLCEAVLHLNLDGATGVALTLDHWSIGDEDDSLPAAFSGHTFGDGIAVSADGVQWHRVTSLTSDFTARSFDLDAVVQAAGISYTSDFQIKFQQYDNYPASSDGREFDNIVVSTGPAVDDLVWGLNDAGGVFVRTGITEGNPTGAAWTRVPGKLEQVSAGEANVWGINTAGGIFVRDGVTQSAPQGTGWTRVAGSLQQVRVGEMGLVWGLNDAGGVFVREGVTAGGLTGTSWARVPGKLAQVSVGEGSAWGVNLSGGVYVREGVSPAGAAGTSWTRVPGTLARVSVGGTGLVWGLNLNGGIFAREGVTEGNPAGTGWARLNGKLAKADVGFVSAWGLNDAGGVWCRTGVCPAQPCGTDWSRVPGGLARVSVGLAKEAVALPLSSKSAAEPVAGSIRSGPARRSAEDGASAWGLEQLAAHSAFIDRAIGDGGNAATPDAPFLYAAFPEGT